MRKLLISILILFTQNLFSQEFQWAKQFGNTQDDRIIASDVDNDGNVYLLGESNSYTFDLNPNSGQEIIINNPNTNAIGNICFIVKLDSDGNYVWSKVLNNGIKSYLDRVFDIKIGEDNNIYALIDVYTYSGNQTITDAQNVIVKLDTNGNELFVKSIKNLQPANTYTNYIKVTSFDLDSFNNIYLGGYFFGQTIVLDPSNSQLNLTSTGAGVFSLKMDNNGNFLWKVCPNIHTSEFISLIIRPDGNLNIVFQSTYPTLICRLLNIDTTNGNVLWEKAFDNSFTFRTFEVSNNGNIILSCQNGIGYTGPITDVDPSANIHNTTAPNFLLYLNANGDFLDVKEYFGKIDLNVIKSDLNNNIYVSGSFSDIYNQSFDADPSSNNFILTSYYCQHGEGFYIKFNSSFAFENAVKLGQADVLPNPGDNIHILRFTDINFKNNYTYFTGFFGGYGDLDPSTETAGFETLHGSATISMDGFVLKLGPCDTRSPNGDSDQYFCSSQNPTIANLSPNSNSIRWYDSLTSTTQLTTTNNLTNGQIYYAAKHPGTCPESTDRLPVTVHISQTPQPPTTSNQAFCENDNATVSNLVATGVNLNWYNVNIGGSPIVSNTILQNNTTYYVSQTLNSCESNRAAVNVTITSNTLPTATSPQNFCIQQNATLSNIVITGQNIKWYNAQTGGNLLPTNTILQNGTTYYASQTSNNCESNRAPVSITIYTTPSPTANSNQSFCSTANATLNDIAISGTNIKWYSNQTITTPLSITTQLINNTTYYASQTLNGCESINRTSITIHLINTLNATDFSDYFCDDLNNGYEKIDLTSYNSSLISNTTGNTFSFYKSFLGAQNQTPSEKINNENDYQLNVGTITIYVRIDNVNTCHQIVELNLTLYSKPIIPIAEVTPICQGNTVTINAGNFDQYQWSTGETSSSILVSQAGNYSVSVTENHIGINCNSTKGFKVVNSNVATISQVITNDWTVNENSITIVVTTSSVGEYQYSIDGNNYQNSNVFTDLYSGEYNIFIRDKNGCGTISEEVFLLMYPKFFTPNGDGFNDKWKIKFSNTETDLRIKLFDKYGKFIKELDYSSDGWNGTFNGKELPSTDYWFVVTRANGKEYRGHFAMKR